MTYNTSKACVHRMKRYLDDMLVAGRTITWPAKKPRQFAYKIREAIYAARHHPEFENYAALRVDYKIYSHAGFVEARYQGEPISEAELVQAPDRMTIEEVTDAPSVVGATIKFTSKADELYFPNAQLSENDKLSVWKWGKMEGWALIDQEDEGITLTRRAVDKIFLWTPADEDEEEE